MKKEFPLFLCEKEKWYRICDIELEPIGVARRLTELGFIKGARLRVIQFSSLRKTLLIEIEGYILSLRSSVAGMVKVRDEY